MVRKKEKTELDTAEIKLESLIERRNAANAEASAVRQERDLFHDQRKALVDQVRTLRDERDALVKEMRIHRDRRNELQAKAKELIELKRKVRGAMHSSIGGDLERLRKEVKDLEMRQQTSPMKLDEENALLDDLRGKLRELRDLEGLKGDQDRVYREVRDLDASITDLFKAADVEHELVVKLSAEQKDRHEKLMPLVGQIDGLTTEADKKHEDYMKARERADDMHKKAMEMREKVLTIRNEKRAEIREARDMIRQQNLTVRKELLDDKKLDKAAEEALQVLLKKGKVEMKG